MALMASKDDMQRLFMTQTLSLMPFKSFNKAQLIKADKDKSRDELLDKLL
ncbi:Uncharacterised protein [Moraxella equi]|uniref:Uncharacterized protein n=1 Tax=Moraxella equi TaxID=60442 RepID=A0A378QQY8_9GAMM|nr:Uncharacterised protein [Moraxella equi]